jgi:hypothetical protein
MTRNLSHHTVVVATGVASLILPGVGCSRETPIRPAANAATVPTLEPCADTKPDQGLLCGRLSIPEDRSKQGGRRIELNVTVVPASATTRQPDPIFHLAGGAGEQATRLAPMWAGLPFERDRDHVFVDQRGMRGSESLYMDLLSARVRLMGARLALDAVRHLRASQAIDELLDVAVRNLQAARSALANPASLPPSFRN